MIGLPILYALTGGLVLRAAIRWFNRMYYPWHRPGENAKPAVKNPWSNESPTVPDPPAPPKSHNGGPLPEPSMPKAIGIQALSFLIHALIIIALGAWPAGLADILPRYLRNAAPLDTVLLTMLSLPAHYLLEAWLRCTVPTTFVRACVLTLIGCLIWFGAGVMLLIMAGVLVAVSDT